MPTNEGAAVIPSVMTGVWSKASCTGTAPAAGIPWRDLPRSEFGPWHTVWKRHRRYAADGTWDRVLMTLLAVPDAQGPLDWTVSADATINRAHQHGTNMTRPDQDTRGWVRITRIHRFASVNQQVTASDGRGAG